MGVMTRQCPVEVTQSSSSGSVHPTATSEPLWPPVICCIGTDTAWLPLGLLMAILSSSGTGVTAAVSGAGYSATSPPKGATAALTRSVGCTSPKSRLQRSATVNVQLEIGMQRMEHAGALTDGVRELTGSRRLCA